MAVTLEVSSKKAEVKKGKAELPFGSAAEFAALVENGTVKLVLGSLPIGGLVLKARHFSGGSLGWRATGVVAVRFGGHDLPCRCDVNLYVKDSKRIAGGADDGDSDSVIE